MWFLRPTLSIYLPWTLSNPLLSIECYFLFISLCVCVNVYTICIWLLFKFNSQFSSLFSPLFFIVLFFSIHIYNFLKIFYRFVFCGNNTCPNQSKSPIVRQFLVIFWGGNRLFIRSGPVLLTFQYVVGQYECESHSTCVIWAWCSDLQVILSPWQLLISHIASLMYFFISSHGNGWTPFSDPYFTQRELFMVLAWCSDFECTSIFDITCRSVFCSWKAVRNTSSTH